MQSIWRMDPIDESARPQLARHTRLKFDAARKQSVLLSPETVWVLNDTGAAIVELCDGKRTVAEIQSELSTRYDEIDDGEVQSFLAALIPKKCMEINHG